MPSYPPRRDISSPLPAGDLYFPKVGERGLYRLSDKVIADWDRYQDLAQSPAPGVLAPADQLIKGPPFRADKGYSWAYSEGIASRIDRAVEIDIINTQQMT